LKHTVVVTGGTKGLGREISLAFARQGSCVIALYSSDEQAARQLTADFANIKAHGIALRHDVCVETPATWLQPEIQNADRLTFIHNACAAFSPTPMHQLSSDDFEKNLAVAVKGAWFCSQPLIRLMLKKKQGDIITILTSAISAIPPKGFAAYAVAKHALRGFTLALASEYSQRGLKIFSVSPSYMETALTDKWDSRLRDAMRSAVRVTVPAKAALQIAGFIYSETTRGQGEDYPV
jgi:3-oxoacyl-[acyl-carrier protein] reductase